MKVSLDGKGLMSGKQLYKVQFNKMPRNQIQQLLLKIEALELSWSII